MRQTSWRLEEIQRIGSENSASTALTPVGGGLYGDDGSIYVLQPMDRFVRKFSKDGVLEAVLGGPGGGPGEFRNPSTMGFLAGRLYVVDRGTGRITFFADGDSIEGEWFPRLQPRPGQTLQPAPTSVLKGRLVLVEARRSYGSAVDGRGVPERFFVVDTAGSEVNAGFDLSRRNFRFAVRNSRSPLMGYFGAQPLADSPLLAVHPKGFFLTIVHRRAERSKGGHVVVGLVRIDPAGDTAWSRSLAVPAIDVPADSRDSLIDVYSRRVADARGPGMNLRQARAAVNDVLFLPEIYPPVTDLMVSDEGDIWLEIASPAGRVSEWRVFDSAGSELGAVRGPPGVEVLDQRGQEVLALIHDELDVPFIVRYRLRKQ